MAVSVIFHVDGAPDELIAEYDAGWPLTPRPDEPGVIYHACLRLPHTIKVIVHFHTEADARAFIDRPDVQESLDAHTLVDGRPAVVPIHAFRVVSDAASQQ